VLMIDLGTAMDIKEEIGMDTLMMMDIPTSLTRDRTTRSLLRNLVKNRHRRPLPSPLYQPRLHQYRPRLHQYRPRLHRVLHPSPRARPRSRRGLPRSHHARLRSRPARLRRLL
jgi:hypothetical protein